MVLNATMLRHGQVLPIFLLICFQSCLKKWTSLNVIYDYIYGLYRLYSTPIYKSTPNCFNHQNHPSELYSIQAKQSQLNWNQIVLVKTSASPFANQQSNHSVVLFTIHCPIFTQCKLNEEMKAC